MLWPKSQWATRRVIYTHWEKYGFKTVQEVPEMQVVDPLYPIPPHWPYLATPAPEVEVEVGAVLELEELEDPGVVPEPLPV